MGGDLSILRWTPIAGVASAAPPMLTDGTADDGRSDISGKKNGHRRSGSVNASSSAAAAGAGGDGENLRIGMSREHSTIMGRSAPLLYEYALIGDWTKLLSRIKTHPAEVSYHDKRRNTALHLACRRQPPVEVVVALIGCGDGTTAHASSANGGSSHSNSGGGGGGGGGAEARTVDGLTPLHFAAYCGASPEVVRILLKRYADYKTAKKQRRNKKPPPRMAASTSSGSIPMCIGASGRSKGASDSEEAVPRLDNPPLDRRLRSPLHLALSGFRNPHRPSVVRLLLQATPACATMADERGRTPLSLLYDDYAEELEDAISDDCSEGHVRRMIQNGGDIGGDGGGGGELAECWINLTHLLRASYHGVVGEDIIPSSSTKYRRAGGYHSSSASLRLDGSTSSSNMNADGANNGVPQASMASEIDLLHGAFRPLHAAVGSFYDVPLPFSMLILKAFPTAVSEPDENFNFPLHLACRAMSAHQTKRLRMGCKDVSTVEYNPLRYNGNMVLDKPRKNESNSSHHQTSQSIQRKPPNSSGALLSISEASGSNRAAKVYNIDLSGRNDKNADYPDQSGTAIISALVELNPHAASVQDDSGKLPLVLAIESGKPWDPAVAALLKAYPEALTDDSGGIKTIRDAVKAGLTSPAPSVRFETAITVREMVSHLPRSFRGTADADGIVEELLVAIRPGTSSLSAIGSPRSVVGDDASVLSAASSVKTDVTGLSTSSARSTRRSDPAIKSAALEALAGVFEAEARRHQQMDQSNGDYDSPIISLPICAEAGLRVGLKSLRHSDESVREAAARVIGEAASLLGPDVVASVLRDRIISFDTKKKKRSLLLGGGLGSSNRSVVTAASGGSFATAREDNDDSDDENESKQLTEASSRKNIIPPTSRHGRIAACYRLLSTSSCASLEIWQGQSNDKDNASIVNEVTKLVKDALLDEDSAVRRTGCLAVGPLLSLVSRPLDSTADASPQKASSLSLSTLKEVRSAVLKRMRTGEEEEVHISLAIGLMGAMKNDKSIFLCKAGLPILDGALVLSVSPLCAVDVQKMFHGFLWLALGVGESDRDGLGEYMKLAQGENGVVVMSLVSKTLSSIECVKGLQ